MCRPLDRQDLVFTFTRVDSLDCVSDFPEIDPWLKFPPYGAKGAYVVPDMGSQIMI